MLMGILGRPSPKNAYTSSSKRSSGGAVGNLFGADSAFNGSKGPPTSGAGAFYKSILIKLILRLSV